ncbi:hypothetical protein FGO68_gene15741 [Halteria grandinella]|uniref:Uncharacterized protein n=1 Tax=Halteria grandinella TaxID=5974 RepID=A0A8J8NB14_HALGN|nr:hypothetical protein FGO68_gene15741 [Halteria grandinella]
MISLGLYVNTNPSVVYCMPPLSDISTTILYSDPGVTAIGGGGKSHSSVLLLIYRPVITRGVAKFSLHWIR